MSGMEIAVLAAVAGSTILSTAGMIQQAGAQKSAAKAQVRAGEFQRQLADREAGEMERIAGQEQAVAQREALEQRRQGRFVSSRAQALAAASGAGALDPTVIDILGGIETEAELRALTALYEGGEAARGLTQSAAMRRFSGEGGVFASRVAAGQSRAAANRSLFAAGGTLLEGGGSLFEKYARYKDYG